MERLRRSEVIHARHTEFSPVLFDVLFGLLIFIGISAFAYLRDSAHFVYTLTAVFVILHWWLKRKAADETYGVEAGSSTTDLLFGIGEIVLLHLALLSAARGDYAMSMAFFAMPLVLEAVRALIWRIFGSWGLATPKRVRYIEQQLGYVIFLNLGTALLLAALSALAPGLLAADLILCFVIAYAGYAVLTHRLDIIDVKLI
jgi:hypothetical protein